MLNANIKNISINLRSSFKDIMFNISFSIPVNSVYTILGRNGSGKSTLIKALSGMLDKRFYNIIGNVEWKGKDLLTIKSTELLKIRMNEIRYVFQDSLRSFDPLKRLKYYFDNCYSSQEQFENLLQEFQLPDYKSISEKYPYELSGGMLQRLNFVLALSAEPELLILDEPTSAIDPINSLLLLNAIQKMVLNKNNSTLIVTQDILFSEKISDKIAFLNEGSLTEFLDFEDFKKSDNQRLKSLINAYEELSK